jgi:hypothetical protein
MGKGKKRGYIGLVLAFALGLSGCAGNGLGSLFTDTEDYRVTIEATEGPILIPPTLIGTIPVPKIGVGLIAFAATFVGESLAEKHDLDACKLESHGAKLEGRSVVASASAFCKFGDKEVTELLIIRMEPVV